MRTIQEIASQKYTDFKEVASIIASSADRIYRVAIGEEASNRSSLVYSGIPIGRVKVSIHSTKGLLLEWNGTDMIFIKPYDFQYMEQEHDQTRIYCKRITYIISIKGY